MGLEVVVGALAVFWIVGWAHFFRSHEEPPLGRPFLLALSCRKSGR